MLKIKLKQLLLLYEKAYYKIENYYYEDES